MGTIGNLGTLGNLGRRKTATGNHDLQAIGCVCFCFCFYFLEGAMSTGYPWATKDGDEKS